MSKILSTFTDSNDSFVIDFIYALEDMESIKYMRCIWYKEISL